MIEPTRSLLSDKEIGKLCMGATRPMIEPFFNQSIRFDENEQKINSYGLSSYGYDVRGNGEWLRYVNNGEVIDVRTMSTEQTETVQADYFILEPGDFVMTVSSERFVMPRDVLAHVLTKSTYARQGIICIATPLEPEWEGHITLEFANTTKRPVKLYANDGIAQIVFYRGTEVETSYADRAGKYQDQPANVVLPR